MPTQTAHERCTAVQLRLSAETLLQVAHPIRHADPRLLQDVANALAVVESCTAKIEISVWGHDVQSRPIQALADLCSHIRARQGGSGWVTVAADAAGLGVVLTVGPLEQTWRNS